MNSYQENNNGISSKTLYTKDTDYIDLTSEYDEKEEIGHITTNFKLMFPELQSICCNDNSLNARIGHSIVNFSEIMNSDIKIIFNSISFLNSCLLKVHQKLDESKLIQSLNIDQVPNPSTYLTPESKEAKILLEEELKLEHKVSKKSDIVAIQLSDEKIKSSNKSFDEVQDISNCENSILKSNCLKIRSRLQREVITKVCKETNCGIEPYILLKRLFKKYTYQIFTKNERNSLIRTIKSIKPGSVVDLQKILYNFPGKSPKTIEAMIENIMPNALIENKISLNPS